MNKRLMFFAALVAAAVTASLAAGSALAASVMYDATPSPLPPNVASLGFEATATSEFGDYVHLAGTDRRLSAVTVTMSNWALHSDYSSDSRYTNPVTWSHPITVNVYSNVLGVDGVPTTRLATMTQAITIPWRPAADPLCGTAWRGADANCYNGIAFNATFDLSSLKVTLPNDVIVGVAYNTADYGRAPIGDPGPYNSLNVGIPSGQIPTVGTDDSPDNVFWNTSHAPFYTDLGAGGVGTFRQDTNWTPNGTAAIQIAGCVPTGLMRDNINLTAAQIGGTVTGTLDATGCNIGAYNPDSVTGATIFGANYYGVVVNADSADITNSTIRNIGETPFNGSQHGVGVLYTTINQASQSTGASATGTLTGTTITDYQKNGVVVSGSGAVVNVLDNTVTGQGPINYIAQNGIQISFGGSGTVTGNTVSGNWYTPADTIACGLLFYQAAGVKQSANLMFGNEVNLCNFGRGGGKSRP